MKAGDKYIMWLALGFAVFAVSDVQAMNNSSRAESTPVAQVIPSSSSDPILTFAAALSDNEFDFRPPLATQLQDQTGNTNNLYAGVPLQKSLALDDFQEILKKDDDFSFWGETPYQIQSTSLPPAGDDNATDRSLDALQETNVNPSEWEQMMRLLFSEQLSPSAQPNFLTDTTDHLMSSQNDMESLIEERMDNCAEAVYREDGSSIESKNSEDGEAEKESDTTDSFQNDFSANDSARSVFSKNLGGNSLQEVPSQKTTFQTQELLLSEEATAAHGDPLASLLKAPSGDDETLITASPLSDAQEIDQQPHLPSNTNGPTEEVLDLLKTLQAQIEKLQKEVESLKATEAGKLTPLKPVAVITKYVEDVRPDQDSEEMSSRTQAERQKIPTIVEEDTASDELSMPTLFLQSPYSAAKEDTELDELSIPDLSPSPQLPYSASQNIKSAEMTEEEKQDLLSSNREKLLREWHTLLVKKNNNSDEALFEWKKRASCAANKARNAAVGKKEKLLTYKRIYSFYLKMAKSDLKRKKNDPEEENSLQPQKKKIHLDKEPVETNSIPLTQHSLSVKSPRKPHAVEKKSISLTALVVQKGNREDAISSWLKNRKQSKAVIRTPRDKAENFISNPKVKPSHSKKSASFEETLLSP